MIRYNLKCENDHSFDSWFQSAQAFEKLFDARMISCSTCGSDNVEKSIMAPQVRPARNASTKAPSKPRPLSEPASPAEAAMTQIREKIEANTEDVGSDFAAQARAMSEGETPARAIRGEAKLDEAKELIDDGIPVTPLPWGKKDKAN